MVASAPKPASAGVVLGASTTATGYVTQDQLAAAIASLIAAFSSQLHTGTTNQQVAANGNPDNPYAAGQRIDNLSNVTISNPTITGGSVTANTFSGTLGVDNGGTGWASLTTGYIPFGNGSLALATSSNLFWDNTNSRLGIGTTSPFAALSVAGNGYFGGSLNVGDPATTRTNLGLGYAAASSVRTAQNSLIAAWGDSLTNGNQDGTGTTYPSVLSDISGFIVYNGGISGQTTAQITARMVGDTSKYALPTVIWSGRNDITGNIGVDEPAIDSGIASMVAALQSVGNSNYIILSVLNGGGEGVGTTDYTEITTINSALAATYGSHYIDVREYLITNGLNVAGLTPTAQDTTDIGNDIPPTSLRTDTLHPNAAGYSVVAQFIYQHFSILSPTTIGTDVLTAQNIAQILNPSTGYRQNGITILNNSNTSLSVSVGQYAGALLLPSATWNTAVGYNALAAATSSTSNTAIGYTALTSNTTGAYNTALGAQSLYFNTTGSSNVALGGGSLYNNTTGVSNTAVGLNVMLANTTGQQMAAFGAGALHNNTTGSYNSAFGTDALFTNTTGNNNSVFGYFALRYNASATSSTAFGFNAAYGTAPYNNQGGTYIGHRSGYSASTGSDYNTLVGYQAGYGITTGSNNIWIGTATSSTGIANLTTGSQNILIGDNISLPSAVNSGQLDIGNIIYGTGNTGTGSTLSSGSIGIGTTTPWKKLSVTGTVGFDGLTGAFGAGSLCLSASKEVVYNAGSDSCLSSLRSTKHDITNLDVDAAAQVLALQPVSFIYNDDASSTVRYGFIAEDTAAVDPPLATYDASGNLSGVDDRGLLSVVVKALQGLINQVSGFALNIVSAHVTATVGDFETVNAKQTNTDKLWVGSICVTQAQFAAVFGAGAGVSSSSDSVSSNSAPDTTPPVITINGNNPTTINVGDNYTDLGASVTDNVDQNLGYKTFFNGTLVSNIVIDTPAAATDTIDYVAADNAGNTATSTRTVVIESPAAAEPAPTP